MHVGSESYRHRPSIATRFGRDCPRDGGAGCGGAIYMRGYGGDRVEEGDCQMSFGSEVVVERMEKQEAEKSLKRKKNHYYALRTIIMYAHLFSKKFRVENRPKPLPSTNHPQQCRPSSRGKFALPKAPTYLRYHPHPQHYPQATQTCLPHPAF
jgi:hypothetical protein